MNDYRSEAVSYYDLSPTSPNDVPFYQQHISANTEILELGCGTGRVLIPLALGGAKIQGIDHSGAMLERCQQRIREANLPADRVRADLGDLSCLDLAHCFDLIIAPFRVMQNLESDAQVDGLFATIRDHLKPSGRCILNAFRPNRDRQGFADWADGVEHLAWELATEDGRITCHDRHVAVQASPLIIYPELIYRRYRDQQQVDQATLRISMRCYYADEFLDLITQHGFTVTRAWGGYQGQVYGKGPELVVEFSLP